MDLDADRSELRRLWRKDRADDDPEFNEVAGVDPIGDIVDRWDQAGRLRDLLATLFEDEDPFIRLRAAQGSLRRTFSSMPPDEAIQALEGIAALPDEVGRTVSLIGFWSYAETARGLLSTQARSAEIQRSDVLAIAEFLTAASQEVGSFIDGGTDEPLDVSSELAELSSALRELAKSDTDSAERIALPWFLAINVLRVLDAFTNNGFVMDSYLEHTGPMNPDAERLGALLATALEPTRAEIGERYDSLTFILWSSGWEIVG